MDKIDKKFLDYGFVKTQENKAGVIYSSVDNMEVDKICIANIYDGSRIETQVVNIYQEDIKTHETHPVILDTNIMKYVYKKAKKINKLSWKAIKEILKLAKKEYPKNLDLSEEEILINNKEMLIDKLYYILFILNSISTNYSNKELISICINVLSRSIRYLKEKDQLNK